MRNLLLAALLAGATAVPARASEVRMHAGELAHELDRVTRAGRVLYVAAHPDDENTRLLAFLANGLHLQAAYLSMTRGGGGQNLIGGEQGVLLDVIRTQELLAARRTDGARQLFTRMRDFGYSKTSSETLAVWENDEALGDVVWAIRSFQPDVIITRFDEDPPNHGHHTASAILARHAFAAAADPNRFTEQFKLGVGAWQAERLLQNLSTWRDERIPAGAIPLDVGAYDPRLGLGYGELAALSRSQHRSQGFGVPGDRGPLIENFLWLAGSKPTSSIFDGVDLSWFRFGAPAEPLVKFLDEARAALERDHPESAIPALVDAHRTFDSLPDVPRVRDARRSLERVIAACSGLFFRANTTQPLVVPGGRLKIDLEVVQRAPASLTLAAVGFPNQEPAAPPEALTVGRRQIISQTVTIAADAPISTPFWLASPPLAGRHQVLDRALAAEPEGPPALTVALYLLVSGRPMTLFVPVVHTWRDPVLGERVRAVTIVPPATLTPEREAFLFPNGAPGSVTLRVRAGRDGVKGRVTLPVPSGWTCVPAAREVEMAKLGDTAAVSFTVTPPADALPTMLDPRVEVDGRSWSFREDAIDYPHLPYQLVLQPSWLRLVPLVLQVPAGLVGYIEGSGDTVAADLSHVGVSVEVLDEATIRGGDLDRFASIVVGIRAFNTRPLVRAARMRLMEFVERGGTVVVQYNTNNWIAAFDGNVGPFPLEIGRDRITDETATIDFRAPDDPAVLRPNALTPADFEGWVQERGIYFATKWDERYTPLFAFSDPGESPLRGSTLIARHGKGRFTYTGLAFFRQLPAGVPGAYRLFTNLIAKD